MHDKIKIWLFTILKSYNSFYNTKNTFPTAVLTLGPKFSHATEAITNNRQGFSILVLVNEAACSVISLLVTVPAVLVAVLPTSEFWLSEDKTWLKMVTWGSSSVPRPHMTSWWLKVTYSFTTSCSSTRLSASGWRLQCLGRLCFSAKYWRLLA